ncbi:MAG: rod shape-determining protein RodA, partial [Alistipes sp.]|nr:rod shape-determining protein RodA [Alistipes sp.]
MTVSRFSGIFGHLDLWTILLYAVIVVLGAVSIFSASYNENSVNMFASSHFYMKQAVWIGIASCAALVVLLLD